MKVIHNYDTWLPITMSWLYNQVRFLPDDIYNYVVCAHTMNLDQFRIPKLYSLDKASIPTIYLNLLQRKMGWTNRHLLAATKKIKPDLLHSHFGHTAWENIITARKAGLRHVVTFYGQDVNFLPIQRPKWKQLYHDLFDHIDVVLCEGPFMKQSIVGLGCPPEKIIVHHLGVEVDKIKYRPRQWSPKTPLKVLIASTFREKKGIPYALKALSAIKDEVDLEITIIGDATREKHSRIEKAKILKIIEDEKLTSFVRFDGFRPHQYLIQEAYKHHIFLSPSVTASSGDTEGGAPVSLIEMSASGMPVISSRHCDIPGVIKHGETGLLAEERDVYELITHLMWMIHNPDKWLYFSEKGRHHIEQHFDVRRQSEKLAAIYKSLNPQPVKN